MSPKISSEGMGVAPPANGLCVVTSARHLPLGHDQGTGFPSAELKPHDEYREQVDRGLQGRGEEGTMRARRDGEKTRANVRMGGSRRINERSQGNRSGEEGCVLGHK
jgi:hypothetical protein